MTISTNMKKTTPVRVDNTNQSTQKTKNKMSTQAKVITGVALTGLAILASYGIYVATKGRAGKVLDSAADSIKKNEELGSEMQRIVDRVKRFDLKFTDIERPELRSKKLFEDMQAADNTVGEISRFNDGKLVVEELDSKNILKRYLVGDTEVASMRCTPSGELKAYDFGDNGFLERISPSGLLITIERSGNKTTIKHYSDKLVTFKEVKQNKNGISTLTCEVGSNGETEKATFESNTKEYTLKTRDGKVSEIMMRKSKKNSNNKFVLSEQSEARCSDGEVLFARKYKYSSDGISEEEFHKE